MSDTPFKIPSPADVKLTSQDLKRMGEDEFRRPMITSDHIYIELRLAKDLFIGTLLSYIIDETKSADLYGHILQQLPEYRKRQYNDTAHYFPAFELTNAQILKRMHDPEYADMIFRATPMTDFTKLFRAQLLVNMNHSSVLGKTDPILTTINTYPLKLSSANETLVGLFFADQYGISTRVTCLDPNTISCNTLLGFDEIYAYNLNDFLMKSKTDRQASEINDAFGKLKFLKKRFFTPNVFGDVIDLKRDVKREEKFTKSYLNILTTFNFIPLPFVTASIPGQEQRADAEINNIIKSFDKGVPNGN